MRALENIDPKRGRVAIHGLLAAVLGTSGCVYDEGLIIHDLKGTVAIPVEAATRTFVYQDEDGNQTEQTVVDPRLIGPVYLGLYPSIEPANVAASYPHPETGPQYIEETPGDAYPYGGTSIGDLRYACLDALTCKVVSGRYYSWDDLHAWFTEVLGSPIKDSAGKVVVDGDLIQQTCFDVLEVTADYEIAVVTGDRNGDEKADDLDLDFRLNGDFFEADFTIWQQQFYWDVEQEAEEGCTPGTDCTGFSLWGFVDSPDLITNEFTTCNPSLGFSADDYDNDYYGGQAHPNVLNMPSLYIDDGDWVASEGFVWSDVYEQPRLVLDFEVTQ